MLRITVVEGASEEKWVLQGQLTKEFVSELIVNWKQSYNHSACQKRLVDLCDVTSIDKSGVQILSMMIHDGATFIATGLYTRHLLEDLNADVTTPTSSD